MTGRTVRTGADRYAVENGERSAPVRGERSAPVRTHHHMNHKGADAALSGVRGRVTNGTDGEGRDDGATLVGAPFAGAVTHPPRCLLALCVGDRAGSGLVAHVLGPLVLGAGRSRGLHKRPPRHLRPGWTAPHGVPGVPSPMLRDRYAGDVCACSHTRARHYSTTGASGPCSDCSCRAYGRAT